MSTAPAQIDARRTSLLVGVLIVPTVVLQRIAVPVGSGQVPIVLPIGLIAIAWALRRGLVVEDRFHLQLYVIAVMVCVVATCVNAWSGGSWSQLSLVYLVLTYLPFVFRLRQRDHCTFERGLRLFVAVMVVFAALGVAETAAQLLGWSYHDLLGSLPSSFLLRNYNTNFPMTYGSHFYKANGFVFLEPSFFSQFVALALIVQGYLGRSTSRTLLFGTALVCAFSGTGLILAAAGMALVWARKSTSTSRLVLPIVALVAAVAVSPLGGFFTNRLHEFSTAGSSAQSRFVTPYRLATDSATSDGSAFFFGHGPGSAERRVQVVVTETGAVPIFPVAAKLVYEYGVPAMCVFMAFVFGATLLRPPSRRLAAVLLVMYLTLSGSLLQPATVFLLYTLTALFGSADEHQPRLRA